MCCCFQDRPCNEIVSLICAYLLPPLGIWWRFGCGMNLCISIVLTCCAYVPGVLYSFIMIGCVPPKGRGVDSSSESDCESGSRW
mmetsp:Transcript_34022/g.102767  ORF Transcript_34022/g.102767 Transcript_34022/m.102767 type:complete len:84 (+) Transcript_34022:72-323(+)